MKSLTGAHASCVRFASILLAVLFSAGAVAPQTCNPDSIQVTTWGNYVNEKYHPDDVWKIVIVPAKLSHDCVGALGTSLHKAEPAVSFEFYDARGVDLAFWSDCQRAGGLDGESCRRYSLKWIDKHAVGFVQRWEPFGTWSVLDGQHKVIARLEPLRGLNP